MKNSQAWFSFLETHLHSQPGACWIRAEAPDRLEIHLPPPGSDWADSPGLEFAVSGVVEEGTTVDARSGEPFSILDQLDADLKKLRQLRPNDPLLAMLKPARDWTRQPAWLLGEYLAERDIPLWIDLLHLAPESVATWAGWVADYGLACARAIIQVSGPTGPEAVSALRGTGTWVIRMSGPPGEGEIEQS